MLNDQQHQSILKLLNEQKTYYHSQIQNIVRPNKNKRQSNKRWRYNIYKRLKIKYKDNNKNNCKRRKVKKKPYGVWNKNISLTRWW